LRLTVIPTTLIVQQRGDMQDTVVMAADGRTFLVRQHTDAVRTPCPLGNFEIRRLNTEAPPHMERGMFACPVGYHPIARTAHPV